MDWLTGVVAFLGAGLGALLSYVAAQRGDCPARPGCSAKALIRLSGGEENVDPMIVKIAHAQRRPRPEAAAS